MGAESSPGHGAAIFRDHSTGRRHLGTFQNVEAAYLCLWEVKGPMTLGSGNGLSARIHLVVCLLREPFSASH